MLMPASLSKGTPLLELAVERGRTRLPLLWRNILHLIMPEPARAFLPPEALGTPTAVDVFSVERPMLLVIINAVVAPAVVVLFFRQTVKFKFTTVTFYLSLSWLNSLPLLVMLVVWMPILWL